MSAEHQQGDESLAELYEDAPCGYLSLRPDGEIVRVNRTFLGWTGYAAGELLGGKRFAALLTMPGALLYETHCAPLLRLRGSIGEIALDVLCRDGKALPVLFSAAAKKDAAGAVTLFRVVILNAPTRREYERELLRARTAADQAAEQLRIHHELAERKVAEQDILLQAVARMAAGDLKAPVHSEPGSWLEPLARGLESMREDILRQIHEMKERNDEVQQLNRELRYQIERRSGLLVESMLAKMDDSAQEVLPILPKGTLLARRYRIGEMLGQGAMGTVYEVERLWDGRRFAAKVLSSRPDYQAMARFAREAQLLARIQHPNLISIIDADVTQDRVAYIIMELVSGKSLAEYDASYGDRSFMLPVLQQIADALAAVHAADVVHRDLKPGNVLVSVSAESARPHAKLVDFGVSRLLASPQSALDAVASAPRVVERALAATGPGGRDATLDDPARSDSLLTALHPRTVTLVTSENRQATMLRQTPTFMPWPAALGSQPGSPPQEASRRRNAPEELTQAGALLGTLRYMAPELCGGAQLAHPPSDIFSFGVMAYEVLTGSFPFEELPLLRSARSPAEPSVRPLIQLCPGLPPALAHELERCLAMDPRRRPPAHELAAVLGQQT